MPLLCCLKIATCSFTFERTQWIVWLVLMRVPWRAATLSSLFIHYSSQYTWTCVSACSSPYFLCLTCRGERVRASLWKPERTPMCREHEGQRSARQRKTWDPQQLDQPQSKRHRHTVHMQTTCWKRWRAVCENFVNTDFMFSLHLQLYWFRSLLKTLLIFLSLIFKSGKKAREQAALKK